jgi:ComF family protein
VLDQHAGWRAVAKVLRSPVTLFHDLVTTLLPADCRLCDGPLERAAAVPVCTNCIARATATRTVGCSICGEAAELALDLEDLLFARSMAEQLLCRECRLAPPAYARAVSFGTYTGELRGLIGLFKFNRMQAVSRLLSPKLAEAMLQLEGVAGNELAVVAVPLFRAAESRRGFNQSQILADGAMKLLRRSRPAWKLTAAHEVLARRRSTESSFGLSRSGRRRNMAGAFEVKGDLRGREVLLVDDILTTGATARECAKVLMRAGAAKVFVATVARSQKGSVRQQHQLAEDVASWDLPAQVH